MKRVLLPAVLVCLMASGLPAQPVRQFGLVTDSLGRPVPGMRVLVKDASRATATDALGAFELEASPGDTLVFLSDGGRSLELPFTGRGTLRLRLPPGMDGPAGDPGLQPEKATAESASRPAGEPPPWPGITHALQGRFAGLYVRSGSGKPEGDPRILLRGPSSIFAGTRPLVVVDGLPVITESIGTLVNEAINPLAELDPDDIESIHVLKDAAATAAYGSRASNGVVLITTRRGRQGPMDLRFSSRWGTSRPAGRIGFLNRSQYLDLFRQAYENNPEAWFFGPDYREALDYGLVYWQGSVDTDWEEQALQQGGVQQYSLSAAGGSRGFRYHASLVRTAQDGILRGSDNSRLGGRLNLDARLSQRLNLALNLALARSEASRVPEDGNPWAPLQMVALPPLDPTHDPYTGELNRQTLYGNGLIAASQNVFNQEVTTGVASLTAAYNLLPGLQLRAGAGMESYRLYETEVLGEDLPGYPGFGQPGMETRREVGMHQNHLSASLDYLGEIVTGAKLGIAAGVRHHAFRRDPAGGLAVPSALSDARAARSPLQTVLSLTAPDHDLLSMIAGFDRGYEYRYLTWHARASLLVRDRYLLELTGSVDGSTRFGDDLRYGVFPAVALGWIVTNEDFLPASRLLSFLKPRFSWGLSGSSEVGDLAWQALYATPLDPGMPDVAFTGQPAPDLKWETTRQMNLGLDFGLLNDRISGSLDHYVKNTDDLLVAVLPNMTGSQQMLRNLGSLRNRGWEVTLHTLNLDRAVTWQTTINLAFNRNEVISLHGHAIREGVFRAVEGQPLGVYVTRAFAGVDPSNGDALFYTDAGRNATTNRIEEAAEQVVGHPHPDVFGGIHNAFRYRGFDLSLLVRFSLGGDIYNAGRQWQADGMTWYDNQAVEFYLHHWQQPGDQARYPQPRWYEGNGYGSSSLLVFDGSYVRLGELALGYTLPGQLVHRIRLTSIRVFLQASNLYTWTRYPGWDPETDYVPAGATLQTRNLVQGQDLYTAPRPRTVIMGVSLRL